MVEQVLELDKTTKNTYVYASPPGVVSKIRTVYVERYTLPSAPKKVRVTVEEVEEE